MSISNVNESNQISTATNDPANVTKWEGMGGKPTTQAPADGTAATAQGGAQGSAQDSGQAASTDQGTTDGGKADQEVVSDNRDQLRRRVQARIDELMAARAQLEGQPTNQDRAQAIETELQVADGAISGGWEHVGEMEAAQLSQWLTNTEVLTLTNSASAPSA